MKIRIFSYLAVFFFLAIGLAKAQNSSEPVNLGTAINSEYEELSPVISGNGQRLFFVRMNHPDNRYGRKRSQDIWFSQKDENGKWAEAERLPDAVNISRYNAVFWANEDGTEIIIKGIFNKSGKEWKERGFSKISCNDKGKWGKPRPIKVKGFEGVNDGNLSSAFFSADESTLVLCFSPTNFGKRSDIYLSTKKGTRYSRPKKMKSVSSKHDEQAPYLAEDGKTLYFSSNIAGNYNIYKSEKVDSAATGWPEATPVNLGVNTSGWDSYFRMFNNGKSALFVSDFNSLGHSDIFMINFAGNDAPKRDTSAASVTFKGVIRNETGAKLANSNFRLIVDSVDVDFINLSPDSAVFEVSLPAKNQFQVTALLPGYAIDTVSLSPQNKGIKLYDIELNAQRLYATPAPAAAKPVHFILSGYITDAASRKPLTVQPEIVLDNASVESKTYDPASGYYTFNFSGEGGNPIVNVGSSDYKPYSQVVYIDNANQDITLDISLFKKSTSITVYGKILNSNTNGPVADIQGLSILVDGTATQSLAYIQEEKSYQINLAKGKKYILEPQLKGFFGVSETVDLSSTTTDKVEKNLFLAPVEVGQSVKLDNIFFKTGSSELLNTSIPELRRVSNFLKENPGMVIEIGGHTDNIGSDTYNLKLSEERAKSVARYIILSGVPRERIEFKGYGETKPLESNDTAAGREKNRRVEFRVLKN